MQNRYLFRGKRIDNGIWEIGSIIALPDGKFEIANKCENPPDSDPMWRKCVVSHFVDPTTICQCTGIKDKKGKLIWENDILICHGNPEDLVKAVFGEFNVINAETLEVIDRVIGWHYEVVPTNALSKCEPFCFPMPLTEEYVKTCEMEVVDNPELLEV